jgi:hypothetical protein
MHHLLRREKVLFGLLRQEYQNQPFCQYENEIVKIIFLRIMLYNLERED